MVESQVRTNKVTDPRIISALEEMPRERFVDEAMQGLAYLDEDIAIGGGRYIMEPMVLARLLQSANARSSDVALLIGLGAGYAAAILARLVDIVVAVEPDAARIGRASALLSELNVDNVIAVEGALRAGYAKQAPYDVILFNGGLEDIPSGVSDQLADHGRLLAVVAAGPGLGKATLVSRMGAVLSRQEIFDASIPVLPGMAEKRGFVF